MSSGWLQTTLNISNEDGQRSFTPICVMEKLRNLCNNDKIFACNVSFELHFHYSFLFAQRLHQCSVVVLPVIVSILGILLYQVRFICSVS